MKRLNRKGFTLAELLIVVAVIAVLTAIAIPIFANQLEKSREATDLANVRAAYAELMTAVHTEDKNADNVVYINGMYRHADVALKQTQDGWAVDASALDIGGVSAGDAGWKGEPRANGSCQVCFVEGADEPVIIDWNGGNSITTKTRWQFAYSSGTVKYEVGNYNDNKGTQVSAVKRPIEITEGSTIELALPESLKNSGSVYKIGLFCVDPEASDGNYTVLVDSTEKTLSASGTNTFVINNSLGNNYNGGIESGRTVGVAVQFFKWTNGKREDLTQTEANLLMSVMKY